ncbi:hypothetical protein [Kineococcus auxinigenes]|uniref:hypothetical protein n=1 Tax=unclassified Kineococcus TaxID=2621656 RepID=UPI003D7EA160
MSDQHPPIDLRKDGDQNPHRRSTTPHPAGYGTTSAGPANALAVVALCLGLAAFLLNWLPFLGLLLGAAGVAVSVVALRRAGRLGRKGMSIAAVVLSGVGTLGALVSTAVWVAVGPQVTDAFRDGFRDGFNSTAPSRAQPVTPGDDAGAASGSSSGAVVLVVGEDIQPGVHTAPPGEYGLCSWSRLSAAPADPAFPDSDLELSSAAAIDGPAVVEVLATDYGLRSSGCGDWSPVDTTKTSPVQSIGPGQHLVGVEVEPGLWQATGPTGECAWMTSSTTTQEDEYTGIQTGVAAAVVDLQPTDEVFSTYGCGEWTKVPQPLTMQPAPADGVVLTGDNLVGRTIAPGTYVSTASEGDIGCYWQKFSDARMQDHTVNGLHKGQHVVEVEATDVVFASSEDCGGWVPADTTPDLENTIGDGDWLVGIDIAPGTYTSNGDAPSDGSCRGEAFSDATHRYESVTGQGHDMESFTVEPGDHLMTLDGCGTYTRTA